MAEIIDFECPFCKQKTIKVIHTPEIYTTQRTKAAGKYKSIPKLSPEKNEIVSEKCSNCGKSKKEIQKALKEGKKPSREEIIKRFQEAGIPTKIVSK